MIFIFILSTIILFEQFWYYMAVYSFLMAKNCIHAVNWKTITLIQFVTIAILLLNLYSTIYYNCLWSVLGVRSAVPVHKAPAVMGTAPEKGESVSFDGW